jgi:hypothetical protein
MRGEWGGSAAEKDGIARVAAGKHDCTAVTAPRVVRAGSRARLHDRQLAVSDDVRFVASRTRSDRFEADPPAVATRSNGGIGIEAPPARPTPMRPGSTRRLFVPFKQVVRFEHLPGYSVRVSRRRSVAFGAQPAPNEPRRTVPRPSESSPLCARTPSRLISLQLYKCNVFVRCSVRSGRRWRLSGVARRRRLRLGGACVCTRRTTP